MRRLITLALAAICATLILTPAAGAFDRNDGFRTNIGDVAADPDNAPIVECNSDPGHLECWWSGNLPPRYSCGELHAVPSYQLRVGGRRSEGVVCMDEGYHNWPRLRPATIWRANGFTCHLLEPRSGYYELFCFAPNGAGFVVDPTRTPIGSNNVTGRNVPVDKATLGQAVSVGDSFSSGEGAGSYDEETNQFSFFGRKRNNGCHRSRRAWPRLLWIPKERHLACSGARITHLYNGQERKGDDRTGQLQRLRSLSRPPMVTVTIGGNDAGFGDIIQDCRLRALGCLRRMNQVEIPRVRGLRNKLASAYRDIRSSAGGGRVLVVGYPDIFPSPQEEWSRCGWMTTDEKRRVQRLTEVLNETIADAAHDAGVEFVSVRSVFDGHELCTPDSWVYAITSAGKSPVNQQQAHPRLIGQVAIAVAVADYLDRHR